MIRFIIFALVMTLNTAAAQEYELKPYTVEYTYKVAWGDFDEFLDLYKRNHWPFLAEAMNEGAILGVVVERPANHTGESDRWDMRVRITYKDVVVAHGLDEFDFEAEANRLFPDQKKFEKEEKRRFELLTGHEDIELRVVDTSEWYSPDKK